MRKFCIRHWRAKFPPLFTVPGWALEYVCIRCAHAKMLRSTRRAEADRARRHARWARI